MDVCTFGHGVFTALGAYWAASGFAPMVDWTTSTDMLRNLMAVLLAMLAAMLVAGAVGLAFERFIVRPVYGQHLKQILVTIGDAIIGEELIKVVWGPSQIPLPLPEALRRAISLGDVPFYRFRLAAVLSRLLVMARPLSAPFRAPLVLPIPPPRLPLPTARPQALRL